MNVVLRGLRIIDPIRGLDTTDRDVWLRDGRLAGLDAHIAASGVPIIDLSPPAGGEPWVFCPAFIDIHVHLRDPGDPLEESAESGARAAVAGGFGQIVAMANTRPPQDRPARLEEALDRAAHVPVWLRQAAAVSEGLRGQRLVDIAACASAGAACLSDDGRNACSSELLAQALAGADDNGLAVLVHPEDEALVSSANPTIPSVVRCPERPVEAEVRAVETAIAALGAAGRGRLHLQHISAAASLEPLRGAREAGLAVTAEVTPHHLAMWLPVEEPPQPPGLLKVNPPLRRMSDREAMVQALREGLIDAVATDHAPHALADKEGDYADAAPGMIGLETALAAALTIGGMGGKWMPELIERLTVGPWRALGEGAGLRRPSLQAGGLLTCTLFDPSAAWTVDDASLHSRSRNTPLLGSSLQGRVLLTVVGGRVVHRDSALPNAVGEALGE